MRRLLWRYYHLEDLSCLDSIALESTFSNTDEKEEEREGEEEVGTEYTLQDP